MSQDNDKSRVTMKDELEIKKLKSEGSVRDGETYAITGLERTRTFLG